MALPKFEQERRIDLVTAVNELSESTQAAFDDLEVDVPVASPDVAGVVKVGSGLSVKQDGTISADVTKDYVANEVAGVEAHLNAFEEETAEQISNESTARQNGDEQLENALSDKLDAKPATATALGGVKVQSVGTVSHSNVIANSDGLLYTQEASSKLSGTVVIGGKKGLSMSGKELVVNAGNGLSINAATGMLEVPIDTDGGLGYSSSGMFINTVESDDNAVIVDNKGVTVGTDMFVGGITTRGRHNDNSLVATAPTVFDCMNDFKPTKDLGGMTFTFNEDNNVGVQCMVMGGLVYVGMVGITLQDVVKKNTFIELFTISTPNIIDFYNADSLNELDSISVNGSLFTFKQNRSDMVAYHAVPGITSTMAMFTYTAHMPVSGALTVGMQCTEDLDASSYLEWANLLINVASSLHKE